MRTRLFVGLVVCSLGLLLAGSASAQDDAMMQKWTEWMTPGENHKLLAMKEGKWDLTVKMWAVPGAPPDVMEGTSEAKMIFEGRYLSDVTQGSFNGMPFEGRGTTGYDNTLKKFVSSWFDNMGTGVMTAEGTYDAKKKEWTYKTSFTDFMNGKPGTGRSTEKIVDDNTWVMQSFRPGPDGKEFQDMEITYKRQK